MKSPKKKVPDRQLPIAWLAMAFVALVGIAAYANSLSGPFIFDDILAIQHNPDIQGKVADSHREITSLAGRPLLRITLIANYKLAGLDVELYHATNIAIHLLAALTLFLVIRRNLADRDFWGDRIASSATYCATVCAAAWVAHPLTTEAVTYIVQRDECMASLFYLLTLYCFIRGAQKEKSSVPWFLLCVGACVAGMGSKQIVITAPVIIFLYDRTFLAGSFRAALQRRWKIHLALLATCIILAAVIIISEKGIKTAGFNLGISIREYARTELGVVARYIRLIFVPTGQVLDYSWPLTKQWSQVPPGGWLVFCLGILTLIALWKKPWIGFVGAWFFVILGPTSSFYPIVTEIAAERRVYLAMAAPLVLVIAGGWILIAKNLDNWQPQSRRALACGLAVLIIGSLLLLTINRNGQYSSAISIWSDTVKKQPDNARAEYNLAHSLGEQKQWLEAIEHYQEALKIEPHFYAAAADLGLTWNDFDWQKAILYYRQEIQDYPEFAPEGHLRLGQIYGHHQDWKSAENEFLESIKANPDNPASHLELSKVYMVYGDIAASENERKEAIREHEAEMAR